MAKKYRVACKSCNKKWGSFDTPDIEVPLSCDECGGRNIGVEAFDSGGVEQLDFDLVLSNRKTGVSKTSSFFIPREKVEESHKNLNKMRELMATAIAENLHTIIAPDVLLVDLIGEVKKHEV